MALTEVQEFYKGKSIFITGGSGFMGKVLIEKLLYSCSELEEIFILMRPKRDKSIDDRLDEMFKLPLFDRLRNERPQLLKRVMPVQGDVKLPNLGLYDAVIERVVEKTNIVFHCGATLSMKAKLKDAINMNVSGTNRVIDLAKRMNNLKAFIHVSTTFCSCDQDILFEKVTGSITEPQDIMRAIEWMDDSTIDLMTPKLLEPHPNTYTYSKRLAESLVRDQQIFMPCAIVRPSIVTPACFEPIEGWVDSMNGIIGILVAAGKGILKSMLGNSAYHAHVYPVDMAINGLITIAYTVATMETRPSEIPVYNMALDRTNRITYDFIIAEGTRTVYELPFEAGIWYPAGVFTKSKIYHKFNLALFHWAPAYLVDFLMICLGKPRFMLRVQQKLTDGLDILQYFTTREWDFRTNKFNAIHENLSLEDQKIFNMDSKSVEEFSYIKKCVLGARQFCMKEPLSTIPKAQRQLKILYVLDRITKVLFLALFVWGFLMVTGFQS